VTGRRGRRRKQLRDDLKEKEGYWHSKMANARINNAGNGHVGTVHRHKEKDIICLSISLRVEYQKRHVIAESVNKALLGQQVQGRASCMACRGRRPCCKTMPQLRQQQSAPSRENSITNFSANNSVCFL
jgi:hypothetical protein